jgi:hypothetical protein
METLTMPMLASIFFRPAMPPLLIATLVAAAIVLSAIAYRRATAGSGLVRVALFAMRAIGVLAVASILLGPSYLPPTVEREVKPGVTVLVDVSESMRTADCGESPRIEAVRSAWLSDAALDRLGGVAEVDLRLVGAFSERIGRAALSGLGPDAASAASSGLIEALGEAVGGVEPGDESHRILLLSDGRDTSGGSPVPLIEVARKRGVAIDTVCVGAAILRRDLLVQAAPTQDFLYANEEGGLLLRVQQVGVPVNTVDVELVISGPEGEHTSSHTIDLRGTTIGEMQVPIRHEKPGQYQYLVRVPTRPEELDTANNSQTLFVDVAKAKARVLMLEGLPSWDMKFVAQSLRKDPRVELTQISRLSEKRTEVIRSGGEQGAKGDVARILAAESLAKIDVFILGAGVDRLLSPEVAAAIRDAVIERGAGVIHARGASYAADADSHATALAPIEPVDWDRSANGTLKNRRIGLARSAGATPWLTSDRLGVDLAALSDRLPPWPIVRGGATPKPATIVLARAGAAGDAPSFADDEANPPAIVSMRAGRGMSVMILGEGMWKWALVDHDRTIFQGMYERCWQGMVRWVASGGDARPGQDITLRLAQQSATIGQSVGIEVLLDRAVAHPPSEVTISLPDGSSERVPLSRSSASELRLEGSFRPARAGVHAVALDAVDIEPARQQRFLSVFDPSVERVNTSADPAFMRLVAERTGGRVFDPADAGSYAEHVRKHRFSTIASNEAQWVWNRFPILLMLCVWLGLEWILRRKVGMP